MGIFKRRGKQSGKELSTQKCQKCGRRPAAEGDILCDFCRSSENLDKMLQEKKV